MRNESTKAAARHQRQAVDPAQRISGVLCLALLLTGLSFGCRSVPPLPAVDLKEPGWTVHQGQAVWKRGPEMPEIAGEILVATRPNGRAFVQFSKNPFPLVIAQRTSNTWQVETPTDGKRYSGHGTPPARLIFLHLANVLSGSPPPKGWTWQKANDNGWRLTNPSRGESLEVFFAQ